MNKSDKRTLTTKIIAFIGSCLIGGVAAASVETSYSYNSLGLVATIDGPRIDLSDITSFSYDTQGNRTSTTNALGHITRITAHDANGRPLTIIDPNGVTTQLSYDARGRLLSRTTNGQTTTMQYDGVGNIIRITQPDSSYINYQYDPARRLIAISDTLGNSIKYTLDSAGNRTKEELFDPADQLTRTHSSVYDELSRLRERIGAASQSSSYQYDPNGNRTGATDPNSNSTTQAFDPLNRLTESTDAINGNTAYTYDAQDNLTSVTDPKGLVTTYSYDGLGNLTAQTSPDTGSTSYSYDEAGNRLTKTDARGITANYSYDALNRVTGIQFPNSQLDISYSYDQGAFGVGRLSRMEDGAGTSQYSYDSRGNLVSHNRTQAGITANTQYQYDSVNRINSITYPSGRIITYTRNSKGQVTDISSMEPGQPAESIVSNISYAPFGATTGWTYGNGLNANINLDLDYQANRITMGSALDRSYIYDPVGNISDITDLQSTGSSQTLAYDALNRLIDAAGGYGDLGYIYDAVGNRTNLTEGVEQKSYIYAATSHQLQDITGATTESRSYDAVGNTLQIGVKQFSYDDTGRLSQANVGTITASYAYNGNGERVSKTIGSESTHFIYNQSGQLIAELNSSGATQREFIYLNGTPISMVGQSVSVGQEVVLDNPDANFSDNWPLSTSVTGHQGDNYQYHAGGTAGPGILGAPIDNTQASYSDSWSNSTSVKQHYGSNYQYHASTTAGVGTLGSPIDNLQATFTGTWSNSTSVKQYYANNYQYHAAGTGSNTATWTPNVSATGSYDIYVTWSAHANRASNAEYAVNHSGGSDIVTANQQQNGGQWNLLGTYTLDSSSTITLSDNANGYVIADAVTILPAGTPPTIIPEQGESATWDLNPSTPGSYDVYASWTAHPNRASDATYMVNHSSGSDSITVNQKQNGGQWNLLGTYTLDSNSTINLSSVANGYVIADGITILPAGTTPTVTPQGETATWTLNQTGEYEIYANWTAHPNRASDATYTINHSGGSSSVAVDQKQDGGQWNLLGTYTLDSSSTIDLSSVANGYVIADGIRLVPTGVGNPASGVYYVHNDHLGTPQAMTDETGAVVWQGDYRPFGQVQVVANTVENPLRFPGQYFDSETGLHYNYFRTYDPSTGRYLESDPIGLRGGLNTYGYVGGNPLGYVDPTGECAGICTGIGIGISLGVRALISYRARQLAATVAIGVAYGEVADLDKRRKEKEREKEREREKEQCDTDRNKQCKKVDADVVSAKDYSSDGVHYLGLIVTCWYQCPDEPTLIGVEHLMSHEVSAFVNNKAKAFSWCPSTL